MAVVGTHVAHRTANLAMQGEYTQARISALSNQRLLQRTRLVDSVTSRYVKVGMTAKHGLGLIRKRG